MGGSKEDAGEPNREDEDGSINRKRLLEASGYVCTKAAASLGLFDVIGIGPTDFVAVQVKTRDWPGSEEMESLREFRCPVNCKRIIHRWRDFQREPDVREV